MRLSYMIKYHTFTSVASYLKETSSLGSSHLRYDAEEFLSTTNKMQRYTMFFIVFSARHVSSGFSAHHQELRNCICSIGTCQTCVLLPLAWLSRN
jgi:hypothetical protein